MYGKCSRRLASIHSTYCRLGPWPDLLVGNYRKAQVGATLPRPIFIVAQRVACGCHPCLVACRRPSYPCRQPACHAISGPSSTTIHGRWCQWQPQCAVPGSARVRRLDRPLNTSFFTISWYAVHGWHPSATRSAAGVRPVRASAPSCPAFGRWAALATAPPPPPPRPAPRPAARPLALPAASDSPVPPVVLPGVF